MTPFDPILAVWADVTRETSSVGRLGPAEAVTPEQALRMHTLWAAYAAFEEQVKGSVERGKYADLAVLSDDILAVAPSAIRDIDVVMTIVGGKVVYAR